MENSSTHKICYNYNSARFVQPLLPTFLNSFSIPVEFVERMEKELKGHPLKSVVLMTEDEPNRQWLVKIQGGRHFKQGWKEFCEEHSLKMGEFVVFSYQHNLVFQVAVFDHATACQRRFVGSSKTKPSELKFNSSDGNTSGKKKPRKTQAQTKPSEEGQCLSCQITLTSFAFKKTLVYLPRYFTRSSGLANRRCEIKLVDSEDRPWKVKLMCRGDGQSYVKGGWASFQAANKFRPQDVIRFQLLKSGNCPVLKCYRLKRRSKS